MRKGSLKLKCSTHVSWLWNKFSAAALLVNIPKTWNVHILKEEIGSTFGYLHSWFDAICPQSRNQEIWQPPIRNHNIAYRNLTEKPKLTPILAKRRASVWRHRCYSGMCVSVLGRTDFVIYLYKCVEKWQNGVKMKTCFTQFSLTSMEKIHTQ